MSDDFYNFHHTITQVAPVSKDVVIWNFRDFGHVNYVHKRSYRFCRVLARHGNITLLEYGTWLSRKWLPIPITHLMWHQFTPPGQIAHLSRSSLGSWTRVVVNIAEFEQDGRPHTRIEHSFFMRLPWYMRPLMPILAGYIERWSELLWEEDMAMCLRRQEALDRGFKDSPMETIPKAPQGLLAGLEPG